MPTTWLDTTEYWALMELKGKRLREWLKNPTPNNEEALDATSDLVEKFFQWMEQQRAETPLHE